MNPDDGQVGRRARPVLHFTARKGWINDPHGVTFRNGRYDLFYQAVPEATHWRPTCSWGHATSPDLITWTQQPTALAPGDGDYGCWSGSISTTPSGTPPTLYYTSAAASDLERGSIRSAHPLDEDWAVWQKDGVLVPPPESDDVTAFRDPHVFWDGDCWRMLVGAGYADGRAAVLCYRSTDHDRWHYEGPLAESADAAPIAPRSRRTVWECPQLIQIGDRHVLLVSVWGDDVTHYACAAVGTYSAGRLVIDHWSRLTHGPGHYAPSFFLDDARKPSLLFWIREVTGYGWSGALSIPYRISLVDDRVVLSPHPAVYGSSPDSEQTMGASWTLNERKNMHLTLRAADGSPIVDLLAGNNTLAVVTPTTTITAPTNAQVINVLVDENVLEVIADQTVIGLPIPASVLGPLPPALTSWWPN